MQWQQPLIFFKKSPR